MRPLIALTSRKSAAADSWRVPVIAVGRPYLEAIARAGGQPVVLPPLDATVDGIGATLSRFDGVCLPGGPDVDPHEYGATDIHDQVRGVDADHDALDLAVARTAVELGLPLLAICRGHQVLNVALGGTLVQHIDDHRHVHHAVTLAPGSLVAAAVGHTTPVGHSMHHQAIDRVGEGLAVTGRADDGTIEAVELSGGAWVVGVQWHPEDTAADDPDQQRLFDAFVRASRAVRR